mgnify:CR=1 FL=1
MIYNYRWRLIFIIVPQDSLEDLLCYANAHLFLPLSDIIYTRNKLLAKLRLDGPSGKSPDENSISLMKTPASVLKKLSEYVLAEGIIG